MSLPLKQHFIKIVRSPKVKDDTVWVNEDSQWIKQFDIWREFRRMCRECNCSFRHLGEETESDNTLIEYYLITVGLN